MTVSQMDESRLAMPGVLAWLAVIAGAGAIFATYWDEAWHTDVGRDTLWSAPHLALYGSVAVVGGSVASWGIWAWVGSGLGAALRHGPLMLAGTGGAAALASAPIDAGWHGAYGRDAVLWSPPHLLVVFASAALLLGVLSGISPERRAVRVATGAILLANLVAVVFEYEADVPQFTETLYLPILLLTGLVVVWLLTDQVPVRFPVTAVVVSYAALRLGVAAGLAALGRSTPDLPLAVLGFAAVDLPLRTPTQRVAAAALATSGIAWAASATGLASIDPAAVAFGAVSVLAVSVLVLAGEAVRSTRAVATAGAVALVALTLSLAPPRPASAHDPGQGDVLKSVRMSASTDGQGGISLSVADDTRCDDLTPVRVVARRAGDARSGPLLRTGACRFAGTVTVPAQGRWFGYVELRTDDGDVLEGWLPLDVETKQRLDEDRPLYVVPPGQATTSVGKVVSGGAIYAAGLTLLAAGVIVSRRSGRQGRARRS